VAAKSGSTLSAGIAMSLKESSNETRKQEMKVMISTREVLNVEQNSKKQKANE